MNRIGLLVAALVVVLVVAWMSGVFDTEYSTLDVPAWEVDRAEMDRLSLRTASDTVTLERAGGVWRVVAPIEARVDSSKLARFLDDLGQLEFGSVASTSAERHARYGVDSTASSVLVGTGESAKVLLVGDSGPDFQTVYVRLRGDERVFASRGRISVDASVDAWRDRTIISLPRTAVIGATVDGEDQEFALSLQSGRWTIEIGGEVVDADSSAVDRWLRRFAPLKGNGFSTAEAFSAAPPLARISFETMGGSTAGLELREDESNLLVRGPGSDGVLTIATGMKNSLLPDPSALTSD